MRLAYEADGSSVAWSHDGGAFELHLIPAPTLEQGTRHFYGLIGGASLLPRRPPQPLAPNFGQQRQHRRPHHVEVRSSVRGRFGRFAHCGREHGAQGLAQVEVLVSHARLCLELCTSAKPGVVNYLARLRMSMSPQQGEAESYEPQLCIG